MAALCSKLCVWRDEDITAISISTYITGKRKEGRKKRQGIGKRLINERRKQGEEQKKNEINISHCYVFVYKRRTVHVVSLNN
jgi:hypothetical protein